jgi:hypothetical protein
LFLIIKASKVSLKCNQLQALPENVGKSVTGSFICALLECVELEELLLCSEELSGEL